MASVRKRLVAHKTMKDGTVRNNRYVYDVYFSYKHPVTGETRRTTRRGFNLRQDAYEEKARIENEIRLGRYIPIKHIKLGEYLSTWLEEEVKESVRYTTYMGYGVNINNHIIPYIGGIELKDLNKNHIKKLYKDLSDSGKKLKPASIKYVHRVFSMALDTAVSDDYILKNVAKEVKTPHVEKFDNEVYNLEEIFILHEIVKETDMEVPIALAGFCGMRRGECLGLTWDNVDLKNKTIYVKVQLSKDATGFILTAPKSETSKRYISLPDPMCETLKKHKIKQNEIILKAGETYNNMNLVNCKANGDFTSSSTFNKKYKRIVEKSELKYIRFHDLRHSYATMLFENKVSLKVISDLLGHSGIAITSDIYTKVLDKTKQQAAESINAASIKLHEGKFKEECIQPYSVVSKQIL